ncbi:unnamed protein product [Acanthosepion pharaonis]|uniref:Uncharacterized protein n=1 Tax=Acanthosepion pharaonis TaxID=158019 RepID=A0A812E7E9_ACAPH|nr:unnamed protein product [Sepia pharaonis]
MILKKTNLENDVSRLHPRHRLCLSLYLYLSLYIYLLIFSISLSLMYLYIYNIFISISLSIYLSFFSIYISLYISIVSVYLSFLSIYIYYIFLSISLYIYSIYLSIYIENVYFQTYLATIPPRLSLSLSLSLALYGSFFASSSLFQDLRRFPPSFSSSTFSPPPLSIYPLVSLYLSINVSLYLTSKNFVPSSQSLIVTIKPSSQQSVSLFLIT